jgi:hypothetical protein
MGVTAFQNRFAQKSKYLGSWLLLTPDSIERPWVLLEVGAAWGRRKNYRIVPVLCHVWFDAIPDIIEGKKAFHINDFDKYLAELQRRVKK